MASESEDVNMANAEVKTENSGLFKKMFPKTFGGIDKKPKPISNAVKKKRANFRLRKLIVPKAPIMVLNELVGAVNYKFVDNPPMPPMGPDFMYATLFTAQCQIDGQFFHGTGPNKQIAKNIAAEHAIQYVVTTKCKDPGSRPKVDSETGEPLKPNQMTDETPWAQLASLALFKMFNDWQSSGFIIPSELLKSPDGHNNQGTVLAKGEAMQTEPTTGEVKEESKQQPAGGAPPLVKKMPDNPTSRHPVQLLNELRGPVNYAMAEQNGNPPNCTFVFVCEIEGKTFRGEGKNKKDAKKECAKAAVRDLYSIVYGPN